MKKIKKIILVLLFCFLSGCSKQTTNFTLNENGSSTLEINYLLDNETFSILENYKINTESEIEQNSQSNDPIAKCHPLFQELATLFYANSFDITSINTEIEFGFKATKNYQNQQELMDDLEKLNNSKLIDLYMDIEIKDGLFSKTYLVQADYDFYLDQDALVDISTKEQLNNIINLDKIKSNLVINMPGKIKNTNGTIDENSVKFEKKINLSKTNNDTNEEDIIFVESEILKSNKITISLILFIPFISYLIYIVNKKSKKYKIKKYEE